MHTNLTEEYILKIPIEKQPFFRELFDQISKNIPVGFEETLSYNLPAFVVSHTQYPPGYHCDKKLPLPFVSVAAQKSHFSLYHMGLYANEELMNWFIEEYPKHTTTKLDLGKGCVRFKKIEQIPFRLIGELMKKMTVKDWINAYESTLKK